jgi:integrase/recombinase XerD
MRSLIKDHLASLEATHYAESTVASRRRDLHHFADWAEVRGVTHPVEVTLVVLERYRHTLFHARKRNGKPLGWGAQAQKLLAVKQFLKWLTKTKIIPCNAGAELDLPRRPTQLPQAVLSVSEVEQVLLQPDTADPVGVRDRAILETLYSTGIRRMELISLLIQSVDRERGTLIVRQGKGRKDRVVPIGDRALEWVERYVDQVRLLWVIEPDPGNVFLTKRGAPLRSNRLTELVHRYVTHAGIGKTGSCHLFRHTMATLMLEGGADIRYIQEMLGHAQLTTTELYTRVSIERLKEVHQRTHPAHCFSTSRAKRADDGEYDELFLSLAAEGE